VSESFKRDWGGGVIRWTGDIGSSSELLATDNTVCILIWANQPGITSALSHSIFSAAIQVNTLIIFISEIRK
jgi:hypothetical protein